jgi:hypothetical protein
MQLSCALGQIEIFIHGRLILKNLAGLSIHLEVTTGWGLDDGRRLRGLLLC